MFKFVLLLLLAVLMISTGNQAVAAPSSAEGAARPISPYVKAKQRQKPYVHRPVTRSHYKGAGNPHRGIFKYFR